ncbi:MAG: aminoacyl-histidine dipeptidase, partial [Eubacteriales bacterium]|nr:aminoacyl-histidine dipeptidase [Eubacteriales bacterium]
VPRGSGMEEKVSDYLVSFAKQRGLEAERDSSLNVLIRKSGTPGYENSEPVIIQGHMDMVCVAKDGMNIDFSTEGIKTVRDGKFLKAAGTSLGADNGIAVAYALALLDSDDIPHPPIEALFTTGEEIGLIGATRLDIQGIKGKTLINLDSEEEGEFLTGCAGGINTDVILPVEWENEKTECCNPKSEKGLYKISICGLSGGHSGLEISKQRANAIKMMVRMLDGIRKEIDFSLVDIKGGSKMNAIPVQAEAIIFSDKSSTLVESVSSWERIFRNEHKTSDPGLKIEFMPVNDGEPKVINRRMKKTSRDSLLNILLLLPDGVQTISREMPGLVQSSNNVGVLRISGDEIILENCPRASIGSLKEEIVNRIELIAALNSARVKNEHDYPEWEYVPESRIRDLFVSVYEELFGKKAKVNAVHAGVECGILGKKLGGLDMVSLGPDMKDVHTSNESLDLESAERVWVLLQEVLRKLR